MSQLPHPHLPHGVHAPHVPHGEHYMETYESDADLRHEDEGYHKGLKPRQLQMIAIGGAYTGEFPVVANRPTDPD